MDATPLEELPEETVDPYPSGPEGDLDRLADSKGWVYDAGTYATVSEYVADICASMPDQDGDGGEAGEWLALRLDGDDAAILKAGMPTICPEWSKVALAAVAGTYMRTYPAGTYVVKKNPKPRDLSSDEDGEMAPGTYRAKGDLDGCYWERTSQSGNIIDNNFATAARSITVTVRAGELFTSRDCDTWKPVK